MSWRRIFCSPILCRATCGAWELWQGGQELKRKDWLLVWGRAGRAGSRRGGLTEIRRRGPAADLASKDWRPAGCARVSISTRARRGWGAELSSRLSSRSAMGVSLADRTSTMCERLTDIDDARGCKRRRPRREPIDAGGAGVAGGGGIDAGGDCGGRWRRCPRARRAAGECGRAGRG